MLIISPPLAKPCEPQPSLGYLAGAFAAHRQPVTVCDLNIEGLLYLMKSEKGDDSTWTRRAVKNLPSNLEALRNRATYTNTDRYRRAVMDLNRIIEVAGKRHSLQLSLANYSDDRFSPLKSEDLLLAADQFESNIFYPFFAPRIEGLLTGSGTKTVGISIGYLSQALTSFAIIGWLRARHPDKKIVIGGGLITTWMSQPGWNQPFDSLVDVCFSGKGENQLLRYAGITPVSENYQPDYSALLHNGYLSPGFVLPYTSSRGCFWKKCSFCPETSENNPYEHNNPNRTVSELVELQNETRPALIHFLDNAVSPTTLQALTNHGLTTPWYSFARFDKQLTDPGFCHALKKSGCTMLKLGLESGDQKVLDQMNKGIDLRLVSQILQNLRDSEIATYIYLLFGTPSEDQDAALRTMDFVEEHHGAITFLNLAIFNLPTCSVETEELTISDFYEGDLSMYRNFDHPKSWNRGKVRRFLDSTFKKSDEISAILKNDPPFFTSNHAPFLASQAMAKP